MRQHDPRGIPRACHPWRGIRGRRQRRVHLGARPDRWHQELRHRLPVVRFADCAHAGWSPGASAYRGAGPGRTLGRRPGPANELQRQAVRTRACQAVAEAVIYTTTGRPSARRSAAFPGARAAGTRCVATAATATCTACWPADYCDLVVEVQLKPHDFMAVVPVMEGAGGRISDWHGRALHSASDGRVVAAGSEALWREAGGAAPRVSRQPANVRSPLTAERKMRSRRSWRIGRAADCRRRTGSSEASWPMTPGCASVTPISASECGIARLVRNSSTQSKHAP